MANASGAMAFPHRLPITWYAAWLLLFAMSGCAGYQVGHSTLYRPDVRTVHVPVFQSDSLRRYQGERLTEAVIKELEMRTPYKVVAATDSPDSVLSGKIIEENKRVVSETINDDARDIATAFTVEVRWLGRNGELLMQRSAFPMLTPGLDLAADANLIPEGGQSLAVAQQQVYQRLARQIVDQMEIFW